MQILPYSQQELEQEKFYHEMKTRWQQMKDWGIGGYLDNPEAQRYWWRVMKKLEVTFQEPSSITDKTLSEKYLPLLWELKFFHLDKLEENEIVELFRQHTVFIMKSDLAETAIMRLYTKVQTIWFLDERDAFLQKIRRALKENKEKIGIMNIQVGDKQVKPYLQNWLLDLENFLGTQVCTSLELAEYFFKSPNAKLITQAERNLLRKIFDFYNILKMPPTSPRSLACPPLEMYGIEVVRSSKGLPSYRPVTPEAKAVWERLAKKEEEAASKQLPQDFVGKIKHFHRSYITPNLRQTTSSLEQKRTTFSSGSKRKKEGEIIPQSVISKLNSKEGLLTFSVEDFRAISPDAREAAKFIFRKIKQLVENEPVRRKEFQEAFFNSPLYKLYLSCGKEAVDTKKTIEEVAKLRQRQGRAYLTENEYKAVGALKAAI